MISHPKTKKFEYPLSDETCALLLLMDAAWSITVGSPTFFFLCVKI